MSSLKNKDRLQHFLEYPSKGLWTLALPMMAGMGIHILYTIVDLFFIGRISGEENAIAAVAFNMPLFFFVLGLTFGLGSGVTSSIARFIGSQQKREADNCAEHALVIGAIISIILTLAGLTKGKEILQLAGATDCMLTLSWSYLQITCFGLPCMIFSGFFRSILSGEGDMKLPMLISAIGTLCNIILDPIFIFWLDFGVKGAAIATIISQFIVFCIFVFMLFVKKHNYIQFQMSNFIFSKKIILDILKVGLPASFSMIIMAFGQLIFNKVLTIHSIKAVAAYQIGGRIDMVIFLPMMSIAAALTTLVGMFYGANKNRQLLFIIKYGISRSLLITLIASITLFLLAPSITHLFSNDLVIQKNAVLYIRCISLIYPFIAIGMSSGRILQGMGRGLPFLVITSIRVLLLSAPLAYYFTIILNKPVQYVWYSMIIASVVATSVAIIWLLYAIQLHLTNSKKT